MPGQMASASGAHVQPRHPDDYRYVPSGEVAERPNAGALKAPEGKLSGGSNPSLAASDRGIDDDG
jgi:hypothetical protein